MLTEQVIQKLKAMHKPKKYADGGGLFLFIPVSGKKLWRMAYRYEKKAKLLTFGEYPQVSLRNARQRRDEARDLLKNGIDPSAHKKAVNKPTDAISFRDVALEWHEQQMLHCERERRVSVLNNLKKRLFPVFGDIAMQDLTIADVMVAIKPFQQSGTLQNGRTLAAICGQICRYAVAVGKVEQDITVHFPPSLSFEFAGRKTDTLDPAKFGQILLNFEQKTGSYPVGCAVRLVPLLFVQDGTLRCAKWKEFDLSRKLWIIPAERMTTKHEHIVPLARQTMKILQELHKCSGGGEFLFPRPTSPQEHVTRSTICNALRKRGYDGVNLSCDNIRSLAAYMLATLGFERKIISLQLGHQGRSHKRSSFDHWQYLPERKIMMQEWANHLTSLRHKALQDSLI